MSTQPVSSVLPSQGELASGDVLLWRGLETQSGEDVSEEEGKEWQAVSKGEA